MCSSLLVDGQLLSLSPSLYPSLSKPTSNKLKYQIDTWDRDLSFPVYKRAVRGGLLHTLSIWMTRLIPPYNLHTQVDPLSASRSSTPACSFRWITISVLLFGPHSPPPTTRFYTVASERIIIWQIPLIFSQLHPIEIPGFKIPEERRSIIGIWCGSVNCHITANYGPWLFGELLNL